MKRTYIVLIVAVLVVVFGLTFGYQYGTAREVTITVTDKDRIVKSDGDGDMESYYLIFTEEEAYKNEDALFYGKFRSSDLQAKLKEGETYKVKVYGWRIGLFSSYPNIVKIVE